MIRSFTVGSLLLSSFAGCAPEGDVAVDEAVPVDGNSMNKIYGGDAPDAWYHDAVVSLHSRSSSTGAVTKSPFCTGTLISTTVVMTAAHCVTSGSSTLAANRVAIYVGDDPGTDLSSHDYTVTRVERHPSYSSSTLYYDIALIELTSAVTESVTPVPPLPSSLALTSADAGINLNFAGFGYTETGAYGDKMQIDLPLGGMGCSVDGCSGSSSSTLQFSYEQDGGNGPCSGDSGGPAFVDRSGTIYVAGMTSYGDAACTRYGVSSHAAAMWSFIDDFLGTDTTTTTTDTGTETCSGYEATYTGTLTGAADSEIEPNDTYYTTTVTGTHAASLTGPSSADFDLYLYKYNSRQRRWSAVASSEGNASSELISYSGAKANYYWLVYSYSGSGDYTLCTNTP